MGIVIAGLLVRANDTAYNEDLNDAIDFLDDTFSDMESDIDSIGDTNSYLDCKKIAVGNEVTDDKHSSEYYYNKSLELLTSGSVVDIGDDDVSIDALSAKKAAEEAVRYYNGAGLIQDFITSDAYGYSIEVNNTYAEELLNNDSGDLPTKPDGTNSTYYSVSAYAAEVVDLVHASDKIVHPAEGGVVTKNTCTSIYNEVQAYW